MTKRMSAALTALRSAVASIDRPMSAAEAKSARAKADAALGDLEHLIGKLARSAPRPDWAEDDQRCNPRALAGKALHFGQRVLIFAASANLASVRDEARKLVELCKWVLNPK